MKRIAIIYFTAFIFNNLTAQYIDNYYSNFYNDSIYYVMYDQVNIRLNPDTAGKVVYKVPFAERLRILEKTEFEYTKNGYTSNWYRVVFAYKGEKAQGYIWGGDIAAKTIKSSVEPNLLFMYGVSQIVQKEYYNEVYINVVACQNKMLSAKLEIRAVGSLSTFHSCESIGPKGIAGLTDIFKINFSDGFCAGSFGDAFFFWDGKTLVHAKTIYQGFDAPYFSNNDFIFPSDKKGKKGLIINYQESGFYDDHDKLKIESWERITYKWDGISLIAIKTQKKNQK